MIFFARYEASQLGAHSIDTSHLLLGILREDKGLTVKVFGTASPFENLAREMGLKQVGEKVSTSVDMPLTEEAKRVLTIAAEESEQAQSEVHCAWAYLVGHYEPAGRGGSIPEEAWS